MTRFAEQLISWLEGCSKEFDCAFFIEYIDCRRTHDDPNSLSGTPNKHESAAVHSVWRTSIRFTLVTAILFGLAYPLLITVNRPCLLSATGLTEASFFATAR